MTRCCHNHRLTNLVIGIKKVGAKEWPIPSMRYPVQDDEYNYHDSLQVRLIEGTGKSENKITNHHLQTSNYSLGQKSIFWSILLCSISIPSVCNTHSCIFILSGSWSSGFSSSSSSCSSTASCDNCSVRSWLPLLPSSSSSSSSSWSSTSLSESSSSSLDSFSANLTEKLRFSYLRFLVMFC